MADSENSVRSERQSTSSVAESGGLPASLRRLEVKLRAVGYGLGAAADALHELDDRLAEGRLQLAVAGQFKRGKSTLLNALLGEEILPVGVVPLTAVPTFVRFGESRAVRVVYTDERTDDTWTVGTPEETQALLRRYVGEQENPRNRLGVDHVIVSHPAPILHSGVALIDMPGVGSTYRHNTETAVEALAECDAALFLVSADPPITEAELDFLRQVRQRAPRIFYLFNKTDYLNADELTVAVQFFRQTLEESEADGEAPIFPLSARRGLAARLAYDSAAWRESGLAEIESHLIGFLEQEKTATLQAAVARRARDLVEDALLKLRLTSRSLELPEAELTKRMTLLDEKLVQARRDEAMAHDLLAADERRLAVALEEQAQALRRQGHHELSRRLSRMLAQGEDNATISARVAETIPRFFEQRLQSVRQSFEEELRSVLGRHEERAEALIEAVYRTAAELFEVPYRPPRHELSLEVRHAPYWVTEKWISTLHVLPPGFFERLLPGGWRTRRRQRRLSADVEALVSRNVENLRWATLQNLKLTFARFRTRVDERLELAVSLTEGAVQATAEQRRRAALETAGELDRIQAAIRRLEELASELTGSEAM